MSSAAEPDGQVPPRTVFPVTWRGYDRDQVDEYVRGVVETVRLLAAERDAAAQRAHRYGTELAALRESYDGLRDRFDRVCGTPVESDGLSERLLRMVELAESEAVEIRAEAEAAARDRAAELDAREEHMLREHERRQEELAERRARWEAEATEAEERAQRRRRELDERATRRRQELEQDFARNLAARRDEANRALAEREAAARSEADRIVADAAQEAADVVDRARARVRTLETARRQVAAELSSARRTLEDALPLIETVPDDLTDDHTPDHTAVDGTGETVPEGDGADRSDGDGTPAEPASAEAEGSAPVEGTPLPSPREPDTTVSTTG